MASFAGPNVVKNSLYNYHVCTTSGVFTPSFSGNIEVMVVAGGGGGGADMGGGGGAGGYLTSTAYAVTSGTSITVTIGAGGAGARGRDLANERGANGSNSVFGSLTAIGGGGGATLHDGNWLPASIGGSGGGASGGGGTNGGANASYGGSYAAGTAGQGNAGGTGANTWYPGGGGGAGAAGSNGPAHGGVGILNTILGPSYYWAGGGGGSGYSGVGGNGGAGGGGGGGVGYTTGGAGFNNGQSGGGGNTGTQSNNPGGNAGANTGGGGGGSSHYNYHNPGGSGGSGIVVIRYLKSLGTSTFGNGSNIDINSLMFSMDAANATKGSSVEVLVVAGGGGGGSDMGGGGGAGGLIYNQAYTTSTGTAITVIIGNGGAGAVGYANTPPAGGLGSNTVFGTLTAIGGGGGGSGHYYPVPYPGIQGTAGGSGGGNSPIWGRNELIFGGSGTVSQGYAGGTAQRGDGQYKAGGGGGASQRGGCGGNTYSGDGGQGFLTSIDGTSRYWAGGGGAAGHDNTAGNGGAGGGGGGSAWDGYTAGSGGAGYNAGGAGTLWVGGASGTGGAGGANTGGGGGGGCHQRNGGAGGSGIVIVRYSGSQRATGGTITTAGGYTVHMFTSSGTFTPTDFLDPKDSSEYNNKITLANGAYYDSANNGGGIVLDGNDDKIIVSNFDYTPYSLSIWLYNNNAVPGNDTAIGGPSTYQTLTSFGGGTPGINLGGWTGAATNEAIHIWGGGKLTYTNQFVPEGYHNFVVNWNGSNYDIWVDGVKQTAIAGGSGHATLVTYTNSPLYIGSDNGTYEFYGKIFKYDMYNRALTDSEIAQNYNTSRGRFMPGTFTTPALNAAAIRTANPSAPDGNYWYKPSGYSTPILLYTNFSSAPTGKGYVLVGRGRESLDWWNTNGQNTSTLTSDYLNINTSVATCSNDFINRLIGQNWNLMKMLVNRLNSLDSWYFQGSTSTTFSWVYFTQSASSVSASATRYASTFKQLGILRDWSANTNWTDTLNYGGGNDCDRVFTWSWSGHGAYQGWSGGSSCTPTGSFQTGGEGHALQLVNCFIEC